MRSSIFAAAMLSLISGTTAHAAKDVGLTAQHFRSGGLQSGVGAQLSISIKLDSKRAVRESERIRIGFTAGPVMIAPNVKTGNIHRGFSNMAGFSLHPGHSVTLTIAGQPVATRYTVRGAAQKAQGDVSEQGRKDKRGPSPVGWIAIGAGAFAVAGLVVGVAYFGRSCPCD